MTTDAAAHVDGAPVQPPSSARTQQQEPTIVNGHALGKFGVFGGPLTPEQASRVEQLGYGTIWVGDSPAGDLLWAEPMLEATADLIVASGIVNIWTADAEAVAQSYHRVDSRFPGRFLLGLGVGHPEANSDYTRPIGAINSFLDTLDNNHVPRSRLILAAMGPKMLDIAADRCVGAHPFLTTPQHTAAARSAVGPAALLAPEHKIVLNTDTNVARRISRATLARYLELSNARRNLERLGFTDTDLTPPGSDHLVDALVMHGPAHTVANDLNAHLHAGADHVAVHVLTPPHELLHTLEALAEHLAW